MTQTPNQDLETEPKTLMMDTWQLSVVLGLGSTVAHLDLALEIP